MFDCWSEFSVPGWGIESVLIATRNYDSLCYNVINLLIFHLHLLSHNHLNQLHPYLPFAYITLLMMQPAVHRFLDQMLPDSTKYHQFITYPNWFGEFFFFLCKSTHHICLVSMHINTELTTSHQLQGGVAKHKLGCQSSHYWSSVMLQHWLFLSFFKLPSVFIMMF